MKNKILVATGSLLLLAAAVFTTTKNNPGEDEHGKDHAKKHGHSPQAQFNENSAKSPTKSQNKSTAQKNTRLTPNLCKYLDINPNTDDDAVIQVLLTEINTLKSNNQSPKEAILFIGQCLAEIDLDIQVPHKTEFLRGMTLQESAEFVANSQSATKEIAHDQFELNAKILLILHFTNGKGILSLEDTQKAIMQRLQLIGNAIDLASSFQRIHTPETLPP